MPDTVPAPQRTAARNREVLRGRLTVYRTPELPQNSVRAIFQDRRGYLWFGTEEGVVRFDGTEWKPYRIPDGLAFSFVQAIAEDSKGCIWVGTRIGLSRFDPVHLRSDAWRSFTTRDGLPHDDVRSICAADDGRLWLATRGGVARLDPQTLRFETVVELPDASAVLADSKGRIWAGSRVEGVGTHDPCSGGWKAVELPDKRVNALAEDRFGALWIATQGAGAFRLDPDGGVFGVTTKEGLPDDKVLAVRCDANGDLWFGFERGGVARARGQRAPGVARWATLAVEEGLPDYMNFSILQDRKGTHWFGSLAGLTSFVPEENDRAKSWTSYTRDDGLAHNLVVAISQDSAGTCWFGTYGRGVSSFREEENAWRTFDAGSGLPNGIVRAIAEDRKGRMWFGTFGGGLARLDRSGGWRAFTTLDGLAGDSVRALSADAAGRIWAGTDGGGVSVFDPDEDSPAFRNFSLESGLPSSRISSILHDSRGRVWVATYEAGVAVREDDRWRVLSTADGLPANAIYCLAEDPAGRFWFGTGGSGLACLEGDRWRRFTRNEGLPNDTIYQLLVESERSIYASTNRGVFRLRLEQDGEVIVAFDRSDGLADDECNGGASFRDRRGRFWIGTLGGASWIDPSQVPERIPPCPVYVTGFRVHDRPMDLDCVEPIEDSQHEFSFDYGAVEFVSPQKIRYRTRLVGFDHDWSRVSSERSIRYTNLRPGSYRLEVQARNWGGIWSRAAALSFQVIADRERLAREEEIERERIEKRVLETAHAKLQQLATELNDAYEKLREKEVLLELQAREDALTSLPNRGYFDHQLQQEFERAVRFRRPLSVVMADLDHFKSINDRFSHAAGDDVLRVVARLMKTSVRSIDTVARYGGEEFVFLLPETSAAAAAGVCEKIRTAIESYPWEQVQRGMKVTASFGLTDETTGASAAQMLHAADQKLFEAKRTGRNRVVQ